VQYISFSFILWLDFAFTVSSSSRHLFITHIHFSSSAHFVFTFHSDTAHSSMAALLHRLLHALSSSISLRLLFFRPHLTGWRVFSLTQVSSRLRISSLISPPLLLRHISHTHRLHISYHCWLFFTFHRATRQTRLFSSSALPPLLVISSFRRAAVILQLHAFTHALVAGCVFFALALSLLSSSFFHPSGCCLRWAALLSLHKGFLRFFPVCWYSGLPPIDGH